MTRASSIKVRSIGQNGYYLAMPDIGNSFVVMNLKRFLLESVRKGIEVTGDL